MMRTIALTAVALAALALSPSAPRAEEGKPSFEVYGFAQVDYIQDFKRVAPDWNATMRATRIPTTKGLYGTDGEAIFSARQSRLGVRGTLPVAGQELATRLEFDFFGRGTGSPDSGGQNTIRLRQAYGKWGPVLGGLTASLFMDDDFWPNIVDYWGPTGMVFFRNVQIRYTPITGVHSFAVALERPGADLQAYTEVIPDLAAANKLPDLTAQYRLAQGWGYLQASAILRRLGYETVGAPNSEPKGSATGWGLNLSSTIKVLPQRLNVLASVVTGAGIENYMNDATPDMAAANAQGGSPKGKAVQMTGMALYADVTWSPLYTSSFGYSMVRLWNTDLQPTSAYKVGQYATANLLVHPFKNLMAGPELIWGKRTDKSGDSGTDVRIQISLKASFSSLEFR